MTSPTCSLASLPTFEEVRVRGLLQRFHERRVPVFGVPGVAERLGRDEDALPRPEALARRDHAGFQRRHRGDRLEGRARRVFAFVGEIGEPAGFFAVAPPLSSSYSRVGERFGELVRVEARRGAHGEHFAVERIHRDEGAGDRGFAARARVFHAFQQRLFAGFLQTEVERRLQRVTGLRRYRREFARDRLAFGVDRDALLARNAAQVAVVVVLEAGLADDGALLDALERAHA